MGNFAKALSLTLNEEGGYSNHAKDPGGKTMRGVTEAVFNGYLIRHGKPIRPVSDITDAEFHEIYLEQYWKPIHGDELPDSAAIMLFDIAVNSGPKMAGKMAQTALGLQVDGIIGNATVGAIREACLHGREGEFIHKLSQIRLNFYKSLPTWGTFGKGWAARNQRITAQALAQVRDDTAPLGLMAAGDLNDGQPLDLVAYQPDAAMSAVPEPLKTAATTQGATSAVAGGLAVGGGALSAFTNVSSWVQMNLGSFLDTKTLLLVVLVGVAVVTGIGWWTTRKARLKDIGQG